MKMNVEEVNLGAKGVYYRTLVGEPGTQGLRGGHLHGAQGGRLPVVPGHAVLMAASMRCARD